MAMHFLLLSVVWHLLASPSFVKGAASSLELSDILAREEDTSSPDAVIVGGTGYNSRVVEVIGNATLPSFPTTFYGNSMAAVGSTIVYCYTTYCYQLNTSDSTPKWLKTPTFSGSTYGYGAVAVNKSVWIFYPDYVLTYQPLANEFGKHAVPFEMNAGQCVVSNGTHAFVLGAGNFRNQVWMSQDANAPESWKYSGRMSRGRSYFGCLWFKKKIILTGGKVSDEILNDYITDDTEIFNPNTLDVTPEAAAMKINRRSHAMFVFKGKPAVVGGYNTVSQLASIETYNLKTGEWTVANRSLLRPRSNFGLAQFDA